MKKLIAAYLLFTCLPAVAQDFSDYPGSPSEHGSVRMDLSVTAEGKVVGCRVEWASGVASLDEAACRIAAPDAPFNPDHDEIGKPAVKHIAFTIHFVTPGMQESSADLPISGLGRDEVVMVYDRCRGDLLGAPQANGLKVVRRCLKPQRLQSSASPTYPSKALKENIQGSTAVIVDINEKGVPIGCDIARTSGHSILDEATCKFVMNKLRYMPGTDFHGNPAGGQDFFFMTWIVPPCVDAWC